MNLKPLIIVVLGLLVQWVQLPQASASSCQSADGVSQACCCGEAGACACSAENDSVPSPLPAPSERDSQVKLPPVAPPVSIDDLPSLVEKSSSPRILPVSQPWTPPAYPGVRPCVSFCSFLI